MKIFLKHLVSSAAIALLLLNVALAQSPEALKYQAVVRDANNAPLGSQAITVRISILENSLTGTIAYEEAHSVTTSPIGLISLNVGEGTPLYGTFDAISWESYEHFLQVEVDQYGGSNYELLGTSQLLSVPYALFAKEAGQVDLVAGEGISIDGNEISNAKPSLWKFKANLVFVDSNQVAIGINDTTVVPSDANLYVHGNIRIAEDSALLGVGQIVGAGRLSFAADSGREDDIVIASTGRVTFEEEVGINQTFSFVDLNVRNQAGNSTVFQVEDTSGTDLFEIGRNGNVGINQITNNVTLQVQNKTNGTNNIIANFEKSDGTNVLQIQDDSDVVVTGDFSVNSGNKNFIMDHPLDPANKILAHNAVESPDHVTYYDGTVQLDANGQATVALPSYFEALNRDFNYQLTCVGAFAQVYISTEIQNNEFAIAGGQPGMKVSWQVSARRNDPWAHDHPYQAEEDKDPSEVGRYYYPEGYGLGRDFQIGASVINGEDR